MQININIANLDNTAYILLFLLFAGVIYLLVRFVLSRKSEDEEDDEEISDDEDEGEEKGKTEEFEKSTKPKILIYFGTQTGSSEEFAGIFEDDSNDKFGFSATTCDIYKYEKYWDDVVKGKFEVVCFICSTYGEGEAPDSARDFLKFLELSKERGTEFKNVNYVLFGLGNSQYTNRYQFFKRQLDTLLEKDLKCTKLFESGEGDADKYIEDDFEDWRESCLEFLSEKFKTEKNENEIIPVPRYRIVWVPKEDDEDCLSDDEDEIPPPFNKPRIRPDARYPFQAKLVSRRELINRKEAKDPRRSALNLEFDITRSKIRYEVGDHFAITPENQKELVMEYLEALKVADKKDQCFSLILIDNPYKGNKYIKKTSVFNVFTYYLDLTSTAKKKGMRLMAEFAKDEQEKKELIFLASKEGKSKYNKDILGCFVTILDLLKHFKSVELPLHVFLEICPMIQPRFYSIASSSLPNKDRVELCFAIYNFTKKTNFPGSKPIPGTGVVSSQIEKLKLNEKVYCWVRESKFHLPKNPKVPIIMVSNGSGIASLRGFIQERRFIKEVEKKELGDAMFFFGCRHKNVDWLYGDELKKAKEDGIISTLSCAFSRDQKEKVYVQNLVQNYQSEILKLINNGAIIYVSGSSNMGNSVYSIFEKILIENVDSIKTKEDVAQFLDERYFNDTWTE